MTARLASRFARNATMVRSEQPLSEDQMRLAAPSIFAEDKHDSRSERYTYVPTIDVLRGLSREGFQPFMVGQSRSRIEGKSEFTKHMVRMRHVEQKAGAEANEIILINSHDGTSSYQMLAGMFRFVCMNGMVCGDVVEDIRLPHKGDVQGFVIDGACRVLAEFDKVAESVDGLKAITLDRGEQEAFAEAALTLRFGDRSAPGATPAPITATQLNEARRFDDRGGNLWTTFQRVQENSIRGGQVGRSAVGRRTTTRPVGSIDRNVDVNRALWVLAEAMRKLKA